MDISTRKITSKKVRDSKVDFSTIGSYIEKNTWKQRQFLDHGNYVVKSTRKRRGFFNQRNYVEKVRGTNVETRRKLVFDIST